MTALIHRPFGGGVSRSAVAIAITASATGLLLASRADAQQQQDTDGEGQVLQLEEIVVTAQKRSESAQDVPIAITALGSDALTARGFDEVSDLQFFVPTLQVTNFQAISFVSIRGIGMENTTSGGDPGVALHLDGVYLGRPVANFFNQFDVERVEVLRGPQGTLYGRNATGGSINLISKKPTDEFEAYGEFGVGKFDRREARGMINVPLGEHLAARAAVTYENHDGFQKNLVPGGTEAQDADDFGIRGHVRADLSSNTDFLVSVNYSDVSGVGPNPELRRVLPVPPGPVPLTPPASADIDDLGPHLVRKDGEESIDMDFLNIAGTFTHDFGNMTFKSVTAYGETSFNTLSDSDGSSFDVTRLNVVEDSEQFTQELQLSSNGSGDLQWLVGAFFFHEESLRFSIFHNPTILDNFAMSPPAQGFLATQRDRLDTFTLQQDPGFISGGDVTADSVAGFAHVTYDLTPEWRLTGGVRVSYDEKDSDQLVALNPLNPPQPDGTPSPPTIANAPAGGDWLQPTGKFVLQWLPTQDTNLYASYSRGYKSGGINLQAPGNAVVDPEKINAFEIGGKTTIGDVLRLNASAFYYGITDLQVQTFGQLGALIENAADATIKGVELEWQAAPLPGLQFNGGISYLDAEFDDFITGDPFSPGFPQVQIDVSDNTLNRAPDWTLSLGGQYTFAIPGDRGELRLRADAYYQTETFFRPFNLEADRADDYENLDLRMFYFAPGDVLNVELYAKNVTDSVQESDILRAPPFNRPSQFLTFRPPRQYGIRVGLRY